jgi:hypothetical protein
MDVDPEDVSRSPRRGVDTHGQCDLGDHYDCGGQCEGNRRAAHWHMLMGYKRSDGKLFLDVGHAPTCSIARTRRTGDSVIRPCEKHYRSLFQHKLTPLSRWVDYILDTLPECPECGNVLHWSKRQELYLFAQCMKDTHETIDPRDIAAELRRLGEIDRCDAHPLVSCVNRCERVISVARCDRSAALQRLAASLDISVQMLRQVLSDDAVSEIMTMRAQ